MKTFCRIVFTMLLCISLYPKALAQDEVIKKKVAVYVTASRDVDESIKKIIGSKLIGAITATNQYAVLERNDDFLAAMTSETDYQTSGEVRNSQIAEMGQKFGAKFVVVADISEAFDEYFVASRLINVVTGLVEKTCEVNGAAETMNQLIRLSQDVANGLLKGTSTGGRSNSGPGNYNGHEYVDLGLPSGLKWATMNVGANSPSDYGQYFAWGETVQKQNFTESNSVTFGRTMGNIGGNPQYDVARANWGGNWRLPTKEEMQELVDYCTWVFTTMGSHNGFMVTGPNGKQIFLPAAGYRYGTSLYTIGSRGDYWSSSPYDGSQYAYKLYFNSDGTRRVDWSIRYCGQSVRPVTE